MRKAASLAIALCLSGAAGCENSPTSSPAGLSPAFDRSERADEVASDALFRFERLVGNHRPFIGSANPIRGINAAGLPWVIRHGEARLDSDGELRVTIRGLVLDPDDPTVISRGLAGNNVSAQFRAVLSCLSVDTGGNAITVNLATQPVDAPTGVGGGDADIREKLSPPTPCIAPIVFITSPGGSWFAASGF